MRVTAAIARAIASLRESEWLDNGGVSDFNLSSNRSNDRFTLAAFTSTCASVFQVSMALSLLADFYYRLSRKAFGQAQRDRSTCPIRMGRGGVSDRYCVWAMTQKIRHRTPWTEHGTLISRLSASSQRSQPGDISRWRRSRSPPNRY